MCFGGRVISYRFTKTPEPADRGAVLLVPAWIRNIYIVENTGDVMPANKNNATEINLLAVDKVLISWLATLACITAPQL